jgi:di/tricarboxylate transporter
MDPALVVALVLGGMILALLLERPPAGVVGALTAAALTAAGIVPVEKTLALLGSETVVAVGAMFVIAAATSRTGALDRLVDLAVRAGAKGRRSFTLWIVIVPALASAGINNTAVVLIFMPIVMAACDRLGEPPSRFLIPLSYASILGGCLTPIGTSTNLVAAAAAREALRAAGLPPFEPTFGAFLPLGLVLLVVGAAYLVVGGRRLLPDRVALSAALGEADVEYVTEVEAGPGSRLIGRPLGELMHRPGGALKLLQLIRDAVVQTPDPNVRVEVGDLLVLKGSPDEIVGLHRDAGTRVLPSLEDGGEELRGRTAAVTLAEVMIAPGSRWLGRHVREIGFRREHGVAVIAVQRHGRHVRAGVELLRLGVGDALLVQGPPEAVRALRTSADLVVIEGVERRVVDRARAPFAWIGLAAFVIGAALFPGATGIVALSVAAGLVATGCISPQEAGRAPDWNVLLLLGGSLVAGEALVRSGLAAEAARLVAATGSADPRPALAAVYVVTLVLTEFLANGTAVALMTPVAVAAAARLGVSPQPFIMATAVAASCAFALPTGYQTHLFVYGVGGYRLRDFLRIGAPLDLVIGAAAVLCLPFFHPFVRN